MIKIRLGNAFGGPMYAERHCIIEGATEQDKRELQNLGLYEGGFGGPATLATSDGKSLEDRVRDWCHNHNASFETYQLKEGVRWK